MTRIGCGLLTLVLSAGYASAGVPGVAPEIDTGAGLLALAAVAGVVAIVREKMRG
ncbi:MAG: hypothetical protein U1E46_02350 [Hyphomicrobiales bacterium]